MLYILERLSYCSTSRIHSSWPCPWVRLNLLLFLFHMNLLFLSWPTRYLTICSNDSCFTCAPSHANATSHIHSHTYLHHIHIIIHSFLHTFSMPLGRPAGPDLSCREQYVSGSWRHKCLRF
jgi:hypothetical protein